MNKIFKILNIRNLYLGIVIYFIYSCVTGERFFNMDTSEFMERYFGITQYILMFILVVNYLLSYVKDNHRRNIFTFINYYLYVGALSVMILWLYYRLGIFGKMGGPELENLFIKLTVFDYKLGLIPSYIASFVLLTDNEKIFYGGIAAVVVTALILLILIINWIFINNFKKLKKGYEKRKSLEEEEAALREKIAIKEAVEKAEVEQRMRLNQEAERRIREEVTTNNPIKDEYDIDEIRSKIQSEMDKRKNGEIK